MPYIDTEHLFKCETCKNHNKSGCATYCDHGESYSPSMSKIPTAEVEEVRHARWHDGICTNCGHEALDYLDETPCGCAMRTYITKYCPECGAKMDSTKERGGEK